MEEKARRRTADRYCRLKVARATCVRGEQAA
jgi:hypothetical protein